MTTSADSVPTVERDRAAATRRRRYDLQLLIIPLALLGALLATTTLSVSIELAMIAPAVAGSAVIVDGLFLNPPSGGSDSN